MKVVHVDVKELWVNTYIQGRKYSHKPSLFTHGVSYLATASLINSGCDLDTASIPIKTWMKSDLRAMMTGRHMPRLLNFYCKKLEMLVDSIKRSGFDTNRSMLGVGIEDGQPHLVDGHRRLAALMALGNPQTLDVGIMDYSDPMNPFRQGFEKMLRMNLDAKIGKTLYQPMMGFPQYSTDKQRDMFSTTLNRILDVCGSVKEKQILDVGSCFGYYSFELARQGAYVIGVDKVSMRTSLSKHLLHIMGEFDWSNPKFIPLPIEKYLTHTNRHFDYALMLNVLHYPLREDKTLAWQMLNQIAEKSDKILLTVDHEPLCVSQEEVGEIILKSSILDHYEDSGPVFKGRHLYVFWK